MHRAVIKINNTGHQIFEKTSEKPEAEVAAMPIVCFSWQYIIFPISQVNSKTSENSN